MGTNNLSGLPAACPTPNERFKSRPGSFSVLSRLESQITQAAFLYFKPCTNLKKIRLPGENSASRNGVPTNPRIQA
jgi:hypothetical protein